MLSCDIVLFSHKPSSYIFVQYFCIRRCQIPSLLNDSYAIQSQEHKELINATIPILPDGSYDECKLIVNGTLTTCSEWVYDQSVFTKTVDSQVNVFSRQFICCYILVGLQHMSIFSFRRYRAEILPIRRKILSDQSINQYLV